MSSLIESTNERGTAVPQAAASGSTYDVYQLQVGMNETKNFTYIIVDRHTRQTAIIDPAWEVDRIEQTFAALDVKPTAILLTHSHKDHVNGVAALAETYGPQVYMSAAEIEASGFEVPGLRAFGDGETLMLGDTRIRMLLTPGHTAGSVCFSLSDSLFTGDTLFIEGCGWCGDATAANQMFDSLQKIRLFVRAATRIYPGHSYGKMPGATFDDVLQCNIYFALDTRDSFVAFRTRKNQKNLYDFK